MMIDMTTHLAVSKVLLVADPRNISTGSEAVSIRRYRLARRRLEGRAGAAIARAGHPGRASD